MKNTQIMAIVLLIIGLGVGFFAGMQFERSGIQKSAQSGQGVNGQGRRFGAGGQNGNNRPVLGEIITVDDKSIVVKMQDGSSKIVLLSNSTQINKAQVAEKIDLKTGEKVAVFGTSNSDGSVTAQNIQLNPQMRGFMSSSSASPR